MKGMKKPKELIVFDKNYSYLKRALISLDKKFNPKKGEKKDAKS